MNRWPLWITCQQLCVHIKSVDDIFLPNVHLSSNIGITENANEDKNKRGGERSASETMSKMEQTKINEWIKWYQIWTVVCILNLDAVA